MNNPFELLDNRLKNIEVMMQYVNNILTDQLQQKNVISSHNLTVKDAAEMLNLTIPTIYSLVCRQELPVCKKGKRLYFSEEELLDWIRTGRKRTREEIEIKAINYLNNKKLKKQAEIN